MAGTCCGRKAARVTRDTINQDLRDLEGSIQAHGTAAARPAQDPNCACDPCMCPSDDVPCSARHLGDDLSDRGLRDALSRLVRQARQVGAAQRGGCDCADQGPLPPAPAGQPWPQRADESSTLLSSSSSTSTSTRTSTALEPSAGALEPRRLGLFSFPAEIRNQIYAEYFDIRWAWPLADIAAVRVRQDYQGTETRLTRNFPEDAPGRAILDHLWDPPEGADPDWRPETNVWQREVAAVTYEVNAPDRQLAAMPPGRLSLLRASRATYEEARHFFYSQHYFRFSGPRNPIPADHGVFHGILAAEAFFTGRRTADVLFGGLILDLRETRTRPRAEGQRVPFAMESSDNSRPQPFQLMNWTHGLNRLDSLSELVRPVQFSLLGLQFDGRPPDWYPRRITDPRGVGEDGFDEFDWARGLFNMGPRDHLHLRITFDCLWLSRQTDAQNIAVVHSAVYFLSVIRNFLLRNSQQHGLRYEGIRVRRWLRPVVDQRARHTVLVELDTEYVERDNQMVHQLDHPEYEPGERPHTHMYMAVDDPPPEVLPPPPPAPPRKREHNRPKKVPEEPKSKLDRR